MARQWGCSSCHPHVAKFRLISRADGSGPTQRHEDERTLKVHPLDCAHPHMCTWASAMAQFLEERPVGELWMAVTEA